MTRSFVFPGQGSQYITMGKALADSFSEAREVFECVDETLKQNLTKIMFEGDEVDLNLTENTQPALMALSMAVLAVLEKQGNIKLDKICTFVAGHSLGEYSALTAVGTLNLEETARVLKIRGQAMQKAVPVGQGSMAAILGLDFEVVEQIVQQATTEQEVCEIANDNTVGQIVISGHVKAVERAVGFASEKGAKRAVILPVSAPFHCSLMNPAANTMAETLATVDFQKPRVPVVANVTAQAETDPNNIRSLLVQQVTGMVRWRESMIYLKNQGITEVVEIGAGKVLCGLMRRIDRDIKTTAVETPEQIEAFLESL